MYLGKLFTFKLLALSSKCVLLCGWEGNRRTGVTMAICKL